MVSEENIKMEGILEGSVEMAKLAGQEVSALLSHLY